MKYVDLLVLTLENSSIDKLMNFLNDDATIKKIITQLEKKGRLIKHNQSVPLFVEFVQNKSLSIEKLRIFLQAANQEFMKLPLKSTRDFNGYLIQFNIEHCRLFCETMSESIHYFTRTAQDLSALLANLSPASCAVIYDTISIKMDALITSSADFNIIMKHLGKEQRQHTFWVCRDKLRGYIQSAHDFNLIMEHLSRKQRKSIYYQMHPNLLSFVKEPTDVSKLLKYLPTKEFMELFECLKLNIKERVDIQALLCSLMTSDQCRIMRTAGMIEPGRHFHEVLSQVDLKGYKAISREIKTNFLQFFGSFDLFITSLPEFDAKKQKAICKVMTTKFPEIITSVQDLIRLKPFLTIKRFKALCRNMVEERSEMIVSVCALIELFEIINIKDCTYLYNAVKGKLFEMKDLTQQGENLIRFLTPLQQIELREALRHSPLNTPSIDGPAGDCNPLSFFKPRRNSLSSLPIIPEQHVSLDCDGL